MRTEKRLTVPVALKAGPTKDRNALEARLPGTALPANFALQVKFKPRDKERVFDFTFGDYSKEPASAPVTTPPPPPATTAATQPPTTASSPTSGAADSAVPLYPYSAADQLPGAGREEVLPTTTPNFSPRSPSAHSR